MTSLVFVLSLQLLMAEQDIGLKDSTTSAPVSQIPRTSALEQGPLVHSLHLSLAQQTMMCFFHIKVKFQVENGPNSLAP